MTRVVIHGALAIELGRAEWDFQIQQPREVLAALEANTGKLYAYLERRHEETKGAAQYRVIVDGQDMEFPAPDKVPAAFYVMGIYAEIHIVPVMQGAGGLWQAIIGVVLIIVGAVLLFTGVASAIAPYVIAAGISLTLGGVAQLLSPSPKLGASPFARNFTNPESLGLKKEDSKATPSYLFSGAVNTTQQGNPVPIAYGGPITVGSALVSMSITTASLSASVIGSQKSPGANDAFYDLPVWERIQTLSWREPIKAISDVQRMGKALVVTTAQGVGHMPIKYPVGYGHTLDGAGIPVGNTTLQQYSYRYYLATVSRLLSGNPRSIKFVEAVDLAKLLGGLGIPDINRAAWKTIVVTIARFYSPEAP